MSTPTEVGSTEFLVLSDLHRLFDRTAGRPFPEPLDGEPFRDSIARRWEELRPALTALAGRLDEARVQGRL